MSKISDLIEKALQEGSDGFKLNNSDPEVMAWARSSGNEIMITFEIDGEKQSAAIKIDKKKKKATSTRA